MPPTIIFTVGRDERPLELLLEQAAAEPRPSAPMAATVIARLNMVGFLPVACWLESCGEGSDSGGFRVARWPPRQDTSLEQRDEVLGGQRDDGHDRHAGEDRVRVEPSLRLADDQPHAPLGAE